MSTRQRLVLLVAGIVTLLVALVPSSSAQTSWAQQFHATGMSMMRTLTENGFKPTGYMRGYVSYVEPTTDIVRSRQVMETVVRLPGSSYVGECICMQAIFQRSVDGKSYQLSEVSFGAPNLEASSHKFITSPPNPTPQATAALISAELQEECQG